MRNTIFRCHVSNSRKNRPCGAEISAPPASARAPLLLPTSVSPSPTWRRPGRPEQFSGPAVARRSDGGEEVIPWDFTVFKGYFDIFVPYLDERGPFSQKNLACGAVQGGSHLSPPGGPTSVFRGPVKRFDWDNTGPGRRRAGGAAGVANQDPAERGGGGGRARRAGQGALLAALRLAGGAGQLQHGPVLAEPPHHRGAGHLRLRGLRRQLLRAGGSLAFECGLRQGVAPALHTPGAQSVSTESRRA